MWFCIGRSNVVNNFIPGPCISPNSSLFPVPDRAVIIPCKLHTSQRPIHEKYEKCISLYCMERQYLACKRNIASVLDSIV